MSTNYSRLLERHIRLMEKVAQGGLEPVEAARVAIEITANWFDEVLSVMGMMPFAIPSLLHWQAHAHEYIDTYQEGDDDETI